MNSFIQNIKELISKHADLFTFLGFVFGFVSLIIAYLFYKKGKRIIKLSGKVFTYALTEKGSKLYDDLEVLYKNEKIDFFCVSKIYLTNIGSVEITKNSISQSHPLHIIVNPGEKILDYEISYLSNEASKPKIDRIEDTTLNVEFDYLNDGDEIFISVIHTSQSESISIEGSIIGQKKPIAEVSRKKAITPTDMFRKNELYLYKHKFLLIFLGIFRISLGIGLAALAYFKNLNLFFSIVLILFGSRLVYMGFRTIIFYNKFNKEKGRLKFIMSKPFLSSYNKELDEIFKP